MAPDISAPTAILDNYWMARDPLETKRLNDQHTLWEKNLGYLVHPNVEASIPAAPVIADVGTGTGVWLLHVAEAYGTSAELHGMDISAGQFPPSELLPANVTLHGGIDLKKPFQSEWLGKFDLVHLRLLMMGMAPSDWAGAVENLKTLLKPGGYLQWEEADFMPIQTTPRTGPSVHAPNIIYATKYAVEACWDRVSATPGELRKAYLSSGLNAVEFDVVASDRLPELRRLSTDVTSRVFHTVYGALGVMAPYTEEKIKEAFKEMPKEADAGAYMVFFIHCHVGRI